MTTHTKPVNIDGKMFKRRGAWFGLFQSGTPDTEQVFYLGTLHGASALTSGKNKLINIYVTYNGEKIAHTLSACPAELTLKTERGDVRFTFADTNKIVSEGDPGMGLRFEKTMGIHESVHKCKDNAWEAFLSNTCSVIFKGLDGSSFDFNDGVTPWNLDKLSSDEIYGQTRPAPNGKFTLVMEESTYGGVVRSEYPSYAEAKASMQSDWDGFIENMPVFKEPYERVREECEYTLWSFLISPCGSAKHTMIQMFALNTASQWQMCQNAVALMEHTDLAIDLLLGPIDRIGPLGQLPDMYDDMKCMSLMVKPPMHGWAVLEIMKRHDLLKCCSRDRIEKLYDGMHRCADWFITCRDDDGDGLPSLVHSDETGFDACSLWVKHNVISTPDIAAYLVLLYEAAGKLASLLGKPESEAKALFNKSETLLNNLIETLWDGERFAGLLPETRELLYSDSIIHYIPVILGERLPPAILDKLAADLSDTQTFFSPWGIASEKMTSDMFSPFGWGRGCVLPPAMLYIVTGLWDTAHRKLARAAAENYCKTLADNGFPFFIDSKTGDGMYYGCSWTNCAYTVLARLISEP